MFRSIWIALSTLAIANLLALGMVFAWLKSTDRLSRDRVEAIRVMFAQTVSAEQAAKDQVAATKDQEDKAAIEKAREKKAPITAEQRLEIIREYEESTRQRTERIQRETTDLINQLDSRRSDIDRQVAAFQKERDGFNAMREALAKTTGSEQFSKTLKVYEAIKAPEAVDMLSTLLSKGEKQQVVAYLNAMQSRTAAKIIAEFQKKDAALAADLLESLRTHGTEAAAAISNASTP